MTPDQSNTRQALSGSAQVLCINSQISRALLLTKQEAFTSESLMLWRLTKHSPTVDETLLASPDLSHCRSRVENAECELKPSWAGGALLLIPLTEEQYQELEIDLERHHVLGLMGDEVAIQAALHKVPCRKRPQVRADHRALPRSDIEPMEDMTAQAVAFAGSAAQHDHDGAPTGVAAQVAPSDRLAGDMVILEVVRTFYHVRLPKLVTEASSAGLAHSSPF